MPKVSGFFDNFDNLDEIRGQDISKWLSLTQDNTSLDNFIANRILYSSAVPVSVDDIKTDLALLREVLRRNAGHGSKTRRITIPTAFLHRFPDLVQLVWAFTDALALTATELGPNVWTVILKSDVMEESAGTVIKPEFFDRDGLMEVQIDDKKQVVKQGSIVVIPCTKKLCQVNFKLKHG